MLKNLVTTVLVVISSVSLAKENSKEPIIIDLRDKTPYVSEELEIDSVWSGHPVSFHLLTDNNCQYVAYYDLNRDMVVAMRVIGSDEWTKFKPRTDYHKAPETNSPATCKLGWDSHNYITMAIDSDGYLHLSGNMHCNNLTYFRSTKPYDIATLKHIKEMTGSEEIQTTYPVFIKKQDGTLLFKYRTGSSGNGNEIYNIYDTNTKQWKRYIDKPLTDGKGLRNAYIHNPKPGSDGMYHISWVWRETYDCSTNHDLSYAKSPDFVNWFTVNNKKIDLPIRLETKGLILDPIPVKGGIINGSGKVGFDNQNNVVLAYHKFDEEGNTQAYCARAINGKWQIKQLTDWNYRWYFEGGGSISTNVKLGEVKPLNEKYLQLDYRHVKYGSGTWLLDNELNICGKVIKSASQPESLGKVESDFNGMQVKWLASKGEYANDTKYWLRWETLPQNRDLARKGKLPQPSRLVLYGIKFR